MSNERIRSMYNAWSWGYEDEFISQNNYIAPLIVFNTIAANTNLKRQGLNVLDVGVGTGLLSEKFRDANQNIHLTGVDVSEGMLGKCRSKKIMDRVVRLDFETEGLCFDDQSFDAVVSSGVFELLKKPATVIREMARVTKPGGIVAFTSVANCADKVPVLCSLVNMVNTVRSLSSQGKYHRRSLLTQATQQNDLQPISETVFTGYRKHGHNVPYRLYLARKIA